MCNYTYLIKYYDLCGRRAEASREEGQKTVFEMRGAAGQRDAEVSGAVGDVAADHPKWEGWGRGLLHSPMQDALTLTLPGPLTQRAGYTTFNRSKEATVESEMDFQWQILNFEF